MNLKNITKVGFIANFNPKKSYSGFPQPVAKVATIAVVAETKSVVKKKVLAGGNKEIKDARKDPKNPRRKSWTLLAKSTVI